MTKSFYLTDMSTIVLICIAMSFAIMIIICGTVLIIKCRKPASQKPPSTMLLQQQCATMRMGKGPLPPVPAEDPSHYRSLMRHAETDTQYGSPNPTMLRNNQFHVPTAPFDGSVDYSCNWRFTSPEWNKPEAEQEGWIQGNQQPQ